MYCPYELQIPKQTNDFDCGVFVIMYLPSVLQQLNLGDPCILAFVQDLELSIPSAPKETNAFMANFLSPTSFIAKDVDDERTTMKRTFAA